MCMDKQHLVVAYGMGVDSTAMLVGMAARGIRPDVILFADTGAEKPETYAYLSVINEWLARRGFPSVTVVRRENCTDATLEAECLRKGILPSLAYGWKTCSIKWKAEPQNKFLNRWEPARWTWKAGRKVVRAIGYDNGKADSRRVKPIVDKKYENWYPLRDWGWDREACMDAILQAGLPLPVKSACFFCPGTKKAELPLLQIQHPDLVERALVIERTAAPNLKSVKGLGRGWSWESQLQTAAVPAGDCAGCGSLF